MDNDNYISDLYKEFISAIESDSSPRFELDEILDIYDYATDIFDEYGRINALIMGLRLYPDSDELRERLAFSIYDDGDRVGAFREIERVRSKSFAGKMLELLVQPMSTDEFECRLDKLIAETESGTLDDESVIRLMDIIEPRGLQTWLVDRYDVLKGIAEYPDTVMNEAAEIAAQSGLDDFRLKVLDEFTTEYPLNEMAWGQLASYYLENLRDTAQAENALSYALAISPDNRNLRIMMQKVKFLNGYEPKEMRRELNSLLKEDPTNDELILQLALMEEVDGREDEAVAILKRGLVEMPYSANMFFHLTRLSPDIGMDVADDFVGAQLAHGVVDLSMIDSMISAAIAENRRVKGILASALLRIFQQQEYSDRIGTLMEWLYMAGEYAQTAAELKARGEAFVFASPAMQLLYALALKRLGRHDELKLFVDKVVTNRSMDRPQTLAEKLSDDGFMHYLSPLVRSITDESVGEEEFDPFVGNEL